MNKSVERTGVIRDDKTGELFLPATQRPDGTWRKAKKVKEGYIPDEEMPRYECRGVQWLKAKPTLPVGLAPEPEKSSQDKPSKSALRRAKKRDKKEKTDKENNEEVEDQIDKLTEAISDLTLTNGDSGLGLVERHKKLRSLRKKMKQIEEMEEQLKINKSLKLEKEQQEKLRRKAQIMAEIDQLEAEDDEE